MNQNYCPHCMHLNPPDASTCAKCHNDIQIKNETHMLPIGTVLNNRYLIGKCLGQGGAGITYIGLDKILKKSIAVKEYYPDTVAKRNNTVSTDILTHSDDETVTWYGKFKERFLEEARILAGFAGNPNIVYVSDLFEENETAYFVMEYVEGESLHEWLKTKDKVPFDEAYAMLKPLLKTIGDINAQGLIHRDISPSNIMITKSGYIKLLDFGAAREYANAGEKSISIVLKPGYAPQEQYNTRGHQGPWTDVYALCATIYKMLTGQIPENALNRLFDDEMPTPSQLGASITPAQEAVLMSGLAVRPKDRIQNMDELLNKFEAANQQTEPVAEPIEEEEEDDDERTLMAPLSKPVTSEAAPPSPRRTAPTENEAEAPSPSRTATTENEAEAPSPSRTATTENEAKAPSPRRTKPAKTGKKSRGKLLTIAAIAVIAIALVAIIKIPKGGSNSGNTEHLGIWTIYPNDEKGDYAYSTETTITTDDLSQIKDCGTLTLDGCNLPQESIDYIGDNFQTRVINMENCTGFTNLNPLARVETLTNLTISGNEEKDWFTTEFPNVQTFIASKGILKDGGQFLNRFTGLKTLQLQNVYQFKGLPELSSELQTLLIVSTDCNQADLTSINTCQNLSVVKMKACNLEDISFLKGMTSLRTVELSQNKLTSLEPLSGIALTNVSVNENQLTNLYGLGNNENLDELNAADNQIRDLSALVNSTGLRKLDLGKNQLEDISPLAEATGMEKLKLYKNQLSDLTPIAGMKELEQLVISDNAVMDLNACKELINLKELIAPRNSLTSIDGLTNCTVLEIVNLASNNLSEAYILEKSAPKLKMLFIENNNISSIRFLSGATELETLSMHHNAVNSLNGLEESGKLKAISAHHNQITDISALKGSNDLYYADLSNNEITDISPVSQKEAIKRILVLNDNKLTDISSLRTDTEYIALALHGNAITDFSVLENLISQNGDEEISLEWNESENMLDSVASTYNGRKVDVVNCPLDHQVNLNTAFKEKTKELHPDKNLAYDVNFYTSQEMEEHLDKLRTETLKKNMEDAYEYQRQEEEDE